MIRSTEWTMESEVQLTDKRLLALEKNIGELNAFQKNHAKVICANVEEIKDLNARFSDLRDLLAWRVEKAERDIKIALVASIVSLSFGLTAVIELSGWFK